MSTLAEQPHAPPTAARSNAKGVVLALMGAVVMSVLTVGVRIAAELEARAVPPVLVM